jgi:hypothetical protein
VATRIAHVHSWSCDAPECDKFETVRHAALPHSQSLTVGVPHNWLEITRGHDGFTTTYHYCPVHSAKLLAVLDGAI